MSHRLLPLLLVALLVAPVAVFTQGGQAQRLEFDAASVKQSESLELDGVFRSPPGRFVVTNLSARWIIRHAYRLRDYQIVGAPAWTETRYQIDATVGNATATDDEVRGMLQRLLVDRFALRARREQRPMPIYELKKVRADGTLGPKLTQPRKDCEGRYCMFHTAGSIKGFNRTMAQLTPLPDPSDQTPEQRAALLTALREQLGLTLEATRAPYDVLVIESISRPTAN